MTQLINTFLAISLYLSLPTVILAESKILNLIEAEPSFHWKSGYGQLNQEKISLLVSQSDVSVKKIHDQLNAKLGKQHTITVEPSPFGSVIIIIPKVECYPCNQERLAALKQAVAISTFALPGAGNYLIASPVGRYCELLFENKKLPHYHGSLLRRYLNEQHVVVHQQWRFEQSYAQQVSFLTPRSVAVVEKELEAELYKEGYRSFTSAFDQIVASGNLSKAERVFVRDNSTVFIRLSREEGQTQAVINEGITK